MKSARAIKRTGENTVSGKEDFMVQPKTIRMPRYRGLSTDYPQRPVQGNTEQKTEFDKWLKLRGDTATLEEQVSLAVQLYDEAEGTKEEKSVLTIVGTLVETDLLGETAVSCQGIQVDWLLAVILESPYFKRLMEFGCPLWFVRKVGILELMRRKGIYIGTFVNKIDRFRASGHAANVVSKPTVFVSYSGAGSLRQFVDQLEYLKGEYVWWDVVCVDQFMWSVHQRKRRDIFPDALFLHSLKDIVFAIGKTALFLEKWDDVMGTTVGQIWIAYEIYVSSESNNELSIILPKRETERFIACLEGHENDSPDAVQKCREILSKIDVSKATTRNADERSAILSLFTEHGIHNVNAQLVSKLRSWLIETGQSHLEHLRTHAHTGFTFLNNFAGLLSDQGLLDKAELLYHEALVTIRHQLGKHDRRTLCSTSNLGVLYAAKGDAVRSECFHREAFMGRKSTLGDCHPATLESMDNLSNILFDQGKLEEAVPLQREVLETRKKMLGDDHPDTLASEASLAGLLSSQGELSKAAPLLERAVAGMAGILGNKHPDTLSSKNNLGNLFCAQGKYHEAEQIYRETLISMRQVYGERHPLVVSIVNNLATVLYDQGRYEEAESYFRQTLLYRRDLLGDGHPDTLDSFDNLGCLLSEKGAYGDALQLHQAALDGRRGILGSEHPDSVSSLNNLAGTLAKIGQLDKARAMYEEALSVRKKVLGCSHPDTLDTMHNIGTVCAEQGNLEKAAALLDESLQGRKQLLGGNHPEVISTMNNVGSVLVAQQRFADAQVVYSKVVNASIEVLGNEHPSTLSAMSNAASVHTRVGDFGEAERLLLLVISGQRRLLGGTHRKTLTAISNLGDLRMSQEQYEEAETLFEEAFRGRRSVLGDHHQLTLTSFHSLSLSRVKLGKVSEAKSMLLEVAAGMKRRREEPSSDSGCGDNNARHCSSASRLTYLLRGEAKRQYLGDDCISGFYTKQKLENGSEIDVGELSVRSVSDPSFAWPMSCCEPFVFLSHCGPDAKEPIARPTRWFLKEYMKVQVFLDDEDMGTGEDQLRSLVEPAYRCNHALVILSPSFRSSEYCVKELNTFVGRRNKRRDGLNIIPVLWRIDNAKGYSAAVKGMNWTRAGTMDPAMYLVEFLWPKLEDIFRNSFRPQLKLERILVSYVKTMRGRTREPIPRSLENFARSHDSKCLIL